ncbi:AraC-type DNA-binding protein [Chitinophaga jiangningensis]|uniref:AraC-type DNA-binding protein n=1 Tax=Chitinophaga jiangningensis TaxID=1419482 RepID=A0A1M6X262_9BACT|nr:AraC family transcriptional regulator [Chitinophaga jiangningensis]SHK99895.1 AraC-type DNA-binding protein [Chitinophaga jiangningensis]
MYSRYTSFSLSGQSYINTEQFEGRDWAAFSMYTSAVVHELLVPDTVVNLVTAGEKRMYCGNRVIHLRQGDILVIPAGSLVSSEILHAGEGFSSLNVIIPDEVITTTPVRYSSFVSGEMQLLPGGNCQALLKGVLSALLNKSGVNLHPREWQSRIWRELRSHSALAAMLQRLSQSRMDPLMEQLSTGISDIREMEDLARAGCMSVATLKRRFRALYGCGPMEWIWKMRLQRAGLLLRSGQEPVRDIAYSTGFSDVSHFYRLFRKQYGVTPVAWRMNKGCDQGLGA